MKRLLMIVLGVSFLSLTSCKLTEPLGQNAYAVNSEEKRFLSDVSISGGVSELKVDQVPYSKKELEEENRQTIFSTIDLKKTLTAMSKRSKNLYSAVDDWYGTRYVFGGTTRRGIDCSAFMQKIYSSVYKYSLPRTARSQFAMSSRVASKKALQEGDLVFFKIRTRHISHVGVYLADGKFAHASSSKGVVISSLSSSYWKRYYVGAGRVKAAVYANLLD